MNKRIWMALLGFALVAAACGGDTGETATTTTAAEAPTTAETTTTAAPTTTTTAATTTTTEAPTLELDAVMASIDANEELTSGRIEGSIEMIGLNEAETGIGEVVILFSTAFDAETGDSSFLMDMSSLAGAIEADGEDPFAALGAGFLSEMEFRQIGDRVYLKFPFFTAMFGAETDWISMPAEGDNELTSGLETFPSDPRDIFEAYEGAEAQIEELGTENVNGVDATHYRITLNVEEMEMTPAERAELEASGLFADGLIPMDLWISGEGYLIRMFLEIDGTGIDAPPEEQFERMTISYDLFDINGEITVEPPPASEVTDIEDLEGGFGFDTES